MLESLGERRGAGGLEFCGSRRGRFRFRYRQACAVDLQRERRKLWLRVRPLRGGNGVAAIAATAVRIPHYRLSGVRAGRILAMVEAFPQTTGVRRSGVCRQRYRNKVSHQREQQQHSGGQEIHAFYFETNPCGLASIEHNRSARKPVHISARICRSRCRKRRARLSAPLP
jgi:hypothetical protein